MRKTMISLVAVLAGLAFYPAVASASISPSLTLNQSAGTTAGTTSYQLGFDLKFNPSSGDTPKDVTNVVPSGLLTDATIDGGACFVASASSPPAACQIGSGTATVSGSSVPAAEFLVAAPKSSDIAGVALQLGGTTVATADVTLRSTPDVGLDVSFTNLPPASSGQLSELNLTLTDLRLPTSCPSPAANFTVSADSYSDSSPKSASAPLMVTGCSSLPYSPGLTASVTKTKSGADIVATMTQTAKESANKGLELDAPSSLSPNVGTLAPCVTVAPCKIGTASAISPLLPAPALANGTVTLGGTLNAPTITVSWPAPLALTLTGSFDVSKNAVTFPNVPDIPLTSLTLNISGSSSGAAFNTNCKPSSFTGKFTAQGGQSHTATAPIVYHGCGAAAGAPSASGSLSGLSSRHPELRIKVKHASGGPGIASLSIGLSSGLRFNAKALKGHKGARGLSVAGAKVKSVKVKGGRLVITLAKAAAGVSLTIHGPLLTESKGLQHKAKKHKVKSASVSLKITDAKGTTSKITLKLKAK